MNSIEVAFSPQLFNLFESKGKVVVVVDILRATSVICTMFHNGVQKIIPVRDLDEARKKKEEGYLVVAERDGRKLEFADFGNSPYYFTPDTVGGKTVVYSTTNGTNAITIGREAEGVIIASFLNFSAVLEYLKSLNKDILILCAGWKGKFCLEDAIFAGALAQSLMQSDMFCTLCDSTKGAIDLWDIAKPNIMEYIQKVAQKGRLQKLGLDDVIGYCFSLDLTTIIPILKGEVIVALSK
jgi:2-phosphosulfolactate phosphatase